MREQFDVPDEVILDESGYSVNIAVSLQGYPGWWNDDPETYARIKATRERLGITIDDFPDGAEEVEKFTTIPMKRRGK